MLENRAGLCLGLILVVLYVGLPSQVTANTEILGCGGFIKSHAEIDFSKIEVKL